MVGDLGVTMGHLRRRDAGVAVVEYALLVAVVATAAGIGLELLSDRAVAVVQRQADCVSQRPAPLSCHSLPQAP
jgi:Flp pilus assembly pilin Flp